MFCGSPGSWDVIRLIGTSVCYLHVWPAKRSVSWSIITLERYFKIVHAIAHRKYYRDWMTSVGVAGPWWVWRNLDGRGMRPRRGRGRAVDLGILHVCHPVNCDYEKCGWSVPGTDAIQRRTKGRLCSLNTIQYRYYKVQYNIFFVSALSRRIKACPPFKYGFKKSKIYDVPAMLIYLGLK